MRVSPFRSAIGFANNNEATNPGTTATLCAIFAKSSSNWRTKIHKAFIPESIVKDDKEPGLKAQLENRRLSYITQVIPGVDPKSVVKFALFDRKSAYISSLVAKRWYA